MKGKIIFFFFLLIILVHTYPKHIHAEVKASEASATFIQPSESKGSEVYDNRAKILRKYFQLYNSPLADNAEDFVREADNNNIDWKLLPAISGVESTFGLAVPPNCNNAWGYNIYGNTTRCFDTYASAISVISSDLRHLYMNQWHANDVYSIGHLYAASPTWGYRVDNYMQTIENFGIQTDDHPLPISL